MVEKANPSANRRIDSFKTAGAIAYGGHDEGFIVDGSSPTQLSIQDDDITEANLNTFVETSSGTSLDVDIDPGEAFVFGSWLAIDSSTTVSLSSSTAAQTVYVGWNKDGSDDVIVGLASAFAEASGDTDKKIPLYDFDTDGTGVTSVTDRRVIGYAQGSTQFTANLDMNGNSVVGTAGEVNFDSNGDLLVGELPLGSDLAIRDSAGNDHIRVNRQNNIAIDYTVDLTSGTPIQSEGTDAITFTGQQVNIPNGDLNLSNSNSIQDAGTSAITFDGSQNVTIPNGDLTVPSNVVIGAGVSVDNGGAGADMAVSTNRFYIAPLDGAGNPQFSDEIFYNPDGAQKWTIEAGLELNPPNDPAGTLGLPQFTSDPTASVGDLWYRSDLD